MKRSDYKQVILAFFVVLVLTSSYLFFLHMYKINNSNEFDSDDLEISFKTENIVELKDTLPLSDVVGKTIDVNDINDGIEGYLEFNIKNNSNQSTNYEIYIKRNQVNSEIDTRYVKIYLSDSDGNPLGIYNNSFSPSYNSLKYLKDKPEAKSVYKSSISGNGKKSFIIRSWVSDGYSFHSNENTFSFSIGVRPI